MGNNTPNVIPNVISSVLDNVDPGRTLQYGPVVVSDWDMGKVGIADWLFLGAPTATKEAVAGASAGKVLKFVYNAIANPTVYQASLELDELFMTNVRLRADSAGRTVRARNGSWASGAGGQEKTVGTDWVMFSFAAIATGSATVAVDLIGTAGYLEIDYIESRKILNP